MSFIVNFPSKGIVIGLAFVLFGFDTSAQEYTVLPGRFEEDRFFVEPVMKDGTKLNLFTDTGGGYFIYKKRALALGLANENQQSIRFPEFDQKASIPSPANKPSNLFLFEPKNAVDAFDYDGMLGQRWFGDRIWVFDYENGKLGLGKAPLPLTAETKKHSVVLSFKTNLRGGRSAHFPRMQFEVGGEKIEVLFDTGATSPLTEAAAKAIGKAGVKEIGTSFIVADIFDEWRKNHPDWKVIEKGESTTGEPLIEVPTVKIAGHEVGPVWFTRRANANFYEYMSKFMDKKIAGALGGSAFKYFVITADYPGSVAYFRKIESSK